MKTICIAGLKGGIAKTNTAIALAYVAANEYGKKVLLIDNDSQSSTSIMLGVTPNNYDKRTPFSNIAEALDKLETEDLSYERNFLDGEPPEDDPEYEDELDVNGIHTVLAEMIQRGKDIDGIPRLDKALIDECIYTPTFKLFQVRKDENGKVIRGEDGKTIKEHVEYEFGFDLMPSTEYLSDVQFFWDADHMGKTNFRLRGIQLKMVVDFIDKNYDYDYCIIDNPPSLDLLAANGMAAAKAGIIIPVSQDKQSLFSLKRIVRAVWPIKWANKGHAGILGVLLTIFNEKRTVDRYIAKTVGHDLRLHVFETRIPETNDAKKAILAGLILPQINERNYKENVKLFKEIEEQIAVCEEHEKAKNNDLGNGSQNEKK